MKEDGNFALYHWAPKDRRKNIIRWGLRPGSLSSCREWKPPYVCLANSPVLAWDLIGRYRPLIKEWDLWWTTGADLFPYETIPNDDGSIREYRVYHRVYKSKLIYIGTRESEFYENPPPYFETMLADD